MELSVKILESKLLVLLKDHLCVKYSARPIPYDHMKQNKSNFLADYSHINQPCVHVSARETPPALVHGNCPLITVATVSNLGKRGTAHANSLKRAPNKC